MMEEGCEADLRASSGSLDGSVEHTFDEENARIGKRIGVLEKIIADQTVGIVQRSKAKVELAQLRGQFKGGGNHDRRGKLASRPSVRGLGAAGLVAKNRVINEYYIKQNEERLQREEEILQIQKELQDELASISAEQRQHLEKRLTAAQEEIEKLASEMDEAEAEDDSAPRKTRVSFGPTSTLETQLESSSTTEEDEPEEEASEIISRLKEQDRRKKLVSRSRPSVRSLDGVGLVAKNRVINEYYIKQNEERLQHEEEILQIQKELHDGLATSSAEHRQQLERRLTAAQDALERLAKEMNEAEDDSAAGFPRSSKLGTQLESTIMEEGETKADDSEEISRLREQIAMLKLEIEDQELTIEGLNILLEDHEKENEVRARELQGTEKLMNHYKSKAQELEDEVETLKSAKEDSEAISSLPQMMPAPRPSRLSQMNSIKGGKSRRFSTRTSINPNFRADLHRAATKGNINDQMREEAKLEMKALEEQLKAMDTEKADLLEELATMRALLESSSNGDGKPKKRERLVYQLSCKKCSKQMNFVGITDRDLRTTMERHFDSVVKVATKKSKSKDEEEEKSGEPDWITEFAQHFAKHCKPTLKFKSVSEKEVRTFCRQNVKVELLKRSDGAELYWEDTE